MVQNLPVPLDRRVWLECQSLRDAGYRVAVVCPAGPGDPKFQTLDGIDLYKYEPLPEREGAVAFFRESVYCWLQTAKLSRRAWRRYPFDAMQACNPPDTYWALAALWSRRGVRFVYDQHDLNPELFRAKFGRPRGPVKRIERRILLWLESRSYRQADHVIATNASYRLIALTRGERDVHEVTIVRSGPDTAVMRPIQPLPELRAGARHLVVYLGIMGSQDGLDALLRSVRAIVHDQGRRDIHFALLGFGERLETLRQLVVTLEIDDVVTFTGRADAQLIARYLSTADLGVCPDQRTVFNDCSTMNKVMEYMAYGLPVVAFDLHESRVSAGDAAEFVESGNVEAFGKAIQGLLDDPVRRVAMGAIGRARAVSDLDWASESRSYVGVYDDLLCPDLTRLDAESWPLVDRRSGTAGTEPLTDEWGHEMLDLRSARGHADHVKASVKGLSREEPVDRIEPVDEVDADDDRSGLGATVATG